MSIKSQFCMKLLEAGADSEIINTYAKNKDRESYEYDSNIEYDETCKNTIKAKKLSNPIFTKSGIWLFNEFLKQKPYRIVLKKLRNYGSKHASRIHSGKNLISQHLKLLSRIAIR
ncbi:hypothetical protein RhiirA4_468086 [Rhizophagus irregularis]|uniref:Uncharacterized protein n=1 Tax=Rhizophagus irregularis TaxID=588596 RepID=A0A2I1GX56_9GLOM|nr:hypothetical protein RhiirA4_468086 [Rhizophagus irregularis]